MLHVTNTLGRSREPVRVPANRPLRLYCCGPTVYRYAHIGNLRTFLLADLLRRVLAYRGLSVHAVQNITDVGHLTDDQVDHGEDKMLVSAGLEGRSTEEIAEAYTAAYLEDAARLNLLPFDAWPRATDHVQDMLGLIDRLVKAGYAYDTADAVYFDVRRFPAYGRLSGNDPDALRAGHRDTAVRPSKRFHGDFALWRKAGARRTVAWDSRYGRGFPGWHIECSAMALACLGEEVDVHVGGIDLVFPHHESEIAQSEAAIGRRWVRTWVHGEHLLSDGRKMSKSAGNFADLRTLTAQGHEPLAFRLLCLQARYRTQLNFTEDALLGAERTLHRLRNRLATLHGAGEPGTAVEDRSATMADYEGRFLAAVEDDLDTPAALAVVHEVAGGQGPAGTLAPRMRAQLLQRWDTVLGLDLNGRPELAGMSDRVDAGTGRGAVLPSGAGELIARRELARTAGDFATADALRAELAARGVEIRDTPEGTRWTLTGAKEG